MFLPSISFYFNKVLKNQFILDSIRSAFMILRGKSCGFFPSKINMFVWNPYRPLTATAASDIKGGSVGRSVTRVSCVPAGHAPRSGASVGGDHLFLWHTPHCGLTQWKPAPGDVVSCSLAPIHTHTFGGYLCAGCACVGRESGPKIAEAEPSIYMLCYVMLSRLSPDNTGILLGTKKKLVFGSNACAVSRVLGRTYRCRCLCW